MGTSFFDTAFDGSAVFLFCKKMFHTAGFGVINKRQDTPKCEEALCGMGVTLGGLLCIPKHHFNVNAVFTRVKTVCISRRVNLRISN